MIPGGGTESVPPCPMARRGAVGFIKSRVHLGPASGMGISRCGDRPDGWRPLGMWRNAHGSLSSKRTYPLVHFLGFL